MSNGVHLGDPPQRGQDPGFIPSPTANDPKAREKATQDDSGFISSPTENSSDTSEHGASGSSQDEGLWSKAWRRANTAPSFIEKHLLAPARKETADIQKKTEQDIAAGHPVSAGFHGFEAGVDSTIDKISEGFFTPISLGLSALSFAEYIPWVARGGKAALATRGAIKTTQLTAGAGFGAQASLTLITPRQSNETEADYIERLSLAGSQLAFSSAGSYSTMKDTTHSFLRNKLGMSDDLAGKVSERVAKITEAKAKEARSISSTRENLAAQQRGIDTEKAQGIVAVQQQLEHNLTQLENQVAARTSHVERSIDEQTKQLQEKLGALDQNKAQMGKSIITDTAHTISQYEAEFDTRFSEIGEKVSGPISTAGDIRSIIEEEAQNHGVQPKEIPSGATAALPKPQGETRIFPEVSALAMEQLKAEGVIQEGEELNFDQLTRVKNDLYNSAYSHKDGAVRSVLFRSAERVSDMQEAAAKKAGQGPQYAKLKGDYMQFIRGIGSGTMRDWLSAENMADQEMSGKVSKLVTPSTAPILRDILKSVGIDTKGFDDVISDIRSGKRTLAKLPAERTKALKGVREGVAETAAREKSTAKGETSRITSKASQENSQARREAATAIKEARATGKAAVKEGEAPGAIIEGKGTSELAGKSNDELLRERLGVIATKMKGMGYMHPWRLMIIAIGFTDMLGGLSQGRLAETARGAAYAGAYLSPSILPHVLRSVKFQDWMLRESGVEPTNVAARNRLRRGIANLYPVLRKAAQSQAPAATLSLGQVPERPQNQQQ